MTNSSVSYSQILLECHSFQTEKQLNHQSNYETLALKSKLDKQESQRAAVLRLKTLMDQCVEIDL